jgi:hypothetical protein
MEKMTNKTNVAMQAISLTRRKKNSPEVEEDKMALSEFLELSSLSRTS